MNAYSKPFGLLLLVIVTCVVCTLRLSTAWAANSTEPPTGEKAVLRLASLRPPLLQGTRSMHR